MSTTNLQPYAPHKAYPMSPDGIARLLADAHAHYEAQVLPRAGLARPAPDPHLHKLLDIAAHHFTEGAYGWPDPATHDALIAHWRAGKAPVPDVRHPAEADGSVSIVDCRFHERQPVGILVSGAADALVAEHMRCVDDFARASTGQFAQSAKAMREAVEASARALLAGALAPAGDTGMPVAAYQDAGYPSNLYLEPPPYEQVDVDALVLQRDAQAAIDRERHRNDDASNQWREVMNACVAALPADVWAAHHAARHPCGNALPVAIAAAVAELTGRIAELEAQRATDEWVALTDEDRTRAFQSLPDALEGFLKTWGWVHFAKAIEAICREKNGGAGKPSMEPS